MSRIGKKAVAVPAGVTANLQGSNLTVKGPKGELRMAFNEHVVIKQEGSGIKVDPRNTSKLARSSWGMSRTMVANMMKGVTEGYSKTLEINGVGYRAAVQGKVLQLNLGYSHDVNYEIPAGIEIKTPKPTEIVVSGIDKHVPISMPDVSWITPSSMPLRTAASTKCSSCSSKRFTSRCRAASRCS